MELQVEAFPKRLHEIETPIA